MSLSAHDEMEEATLLIPSADLIGLTDSKKYVVASVKTPRKYMRVR